MTNAELIETIRNEIERRLKNTRDYMNGAGMKYKGPKYHASRGRESAYDAILSFISDLGKSLPAKVADDDGLNREIKSFTEELECGTINLYRLMFGKEGNFDKFSWENIEAIVKDTAHYFYELGCRRTAEKYDEIEYNRQRASGSSEVPNDLEEAAREYEQTRQDADARSDNEVVRRAFIAGSKWDREQILEYVKLAYGKVSMNPFDCSEAFEELINKINAL